VNRRSFLKTLLALIGTAPTISQGRSRVSTPDSFDDEWLELIRCPVAGLQYHDGADLKYRPGERLTLRREPTNPYDPNAIAIYRGNIHIGYLPKRYNIPYARLMDEGESLKCHVSFYDADAPSWERVEVVVYRRRG